MEIPVGQVVQVTWEDAELELELKPGSFADLAKLARNLARRTADIVDGSLESSIKTSASRPTRCMRRRRG